MAKHAYCILAHNEPELFRRLVLLLDHPENDLFIHIDKRSDISLFQTVSCRYSHMTFIKERRACNWGSLSIVKAEIALFETALRKGPYAYYHLLSGVDMPLKGQEERRRWNVTVSGGAGYMVHEPGRYDKLARSFSYPTADLRIGYATSSDDPSSYASLYGFPNIGLGVNWKGTSHFDWVGKSHLNDLVSLYGFFERDFIRTRKFSFGYDLSLGMAFNSAVHDKDDNPENIIFSSAVLVYVAPALHLSYRPTRHLQLGLSGVLTHMSTGRLAYPNAGFNGVDVVASARYAMAEPRIPECRESEKPVFERHMLYEVYAGYGAHRCAQEFEATGKTTPWPD